MVFFIISTISYILGMSFASYLEIQSGFFFLFLSAFFVAGAFIPLWTRHSQSIQEGAWREIIHGEDALPIATMIFIFLAAFLFGIFRYVYALYPIPANHLDKVMQSENAFAKWRVVGKILEEPTLKQDYLEVLIEPEFVQEVAKTKNPKWQLKKKKKSSKKGKMKSKSKLKDQEELVSEPEDPPNPEVKVTGGLILAKVFEDSKAFSRMKFNQQIEISGSFSFPTKQRNPGSLDYQKSLIHRGIYRTIRMTGKSGIFKEIGEGGFGSYWYRFALYLRAECLKVVKQTIPYPESSFLGGVLLGLRGGVPPNVIKEFRMTGVSHVLAVSGLHVTIIAGLLYGLFVAFRVPIKVFAPFICFFLFTFALIVGWPSSAVRAALMNSLFILSRAYLRDYGFKQSIVFALSVAGVYILTMSPLQLTEPSFTLSMMAIYALAMFTDPSEKLLKGCLRGPGLTFFVFMVVSFYVSLTVQHSLILYEYFFFGVGIYFLLTFLAARKLSQSSEFQSFSFEMLPGWLRSFMAAQLAIFLGMMGPLSAFYFGSTSLAAPLANMIAIPLIGVIVQLGLIAGILGAFLPVVGIYLSLILNAANWLAIKFFLGVAHFFAVLIPFPRVSQPTFGMILLYYGLLHLIFYWEEIWNYSTALFDAVIDLWHDPDYKMSMAMIIGLFFGVIFFFLIVGSSRIQRRPELRVTALDVGFGSSLLVEKGGKALLIDAGMNDELSGIDSGERTIEPALSSKNIRGLHGVILTTLLPENVSGLFQVMEDYKVRNLYCPFPVPKDGKTVPFHVFLERFSLSDRKMERAIKDGEIFSSPPSYYWEQVFSSYNQLIKMVYKGEIPVTEVIEGTPIAGFEGVVEVVYPSRIREKFNCFYDSAIIVVKHGENQVAYVPPNANSWHKLADQSLDALIIGGLPAPQKEFEDFYQKVKPGNVILSFRSPSGWLMDRFYLGKILQGRVFRFQRRTKELGWKLFRTDRNGAVQMDFGGKFSVLPFVTEPE